MCNCCTDLLLLTILTHHVQGLQRAEGILLQSADAVRNVKKCTKNDIKTKCTSQNCYCYTLNCYWLYIRTTGEIKATVKSRTINNCRKPPNQQKARIARRWTRMSCQQLLLFAIFQHTGINYSDRKNLRVDFTDFCRETRHQSNRN